MVRDLSPKDKRIINYDLNLLFSIKNYIIPTTIEDYKRIGFFSPHLKVSGHYIYLKDSARAALQRVVEIIIKEYELVKFATYNDMWQLVKSHIEMWFEEMFIPDADELLERLLPAFTEFKKARKYIYRVEGLQLVDIDTIELGTKTLHKQFYWDLIDGVEIDEALRETIEKEFGGQCVIKGGYVGSTKKAQMKFVFSAEMAISVLRLYGCLLYGSALTNTYIRLVDNSLGARVATSSLSWCEEGGHLGFSQYWGKEQPLELSHEALNYLTEQCFFMQTFQCLEKEVKTELEDAISRAIYWFGEAYKDRDDTMKFVKLWSCVEAFFSIEEDQITMINAMGLSVVLAYGGYSVIDVTDYKEFRKKITKLYDLRSKALHRAYHGHIGLSELIGFARIVAWLIISMVSFSLKGYSELQAVLRECRRIDDAESKKN